MSKLTLMIVCVVAGALVVATAAGASRERDPLPRQAYKAVARCAARAGASEVDRYRFGGAMRFGLASPAILTSGGLPLRSEGLAGSGEVDWGYAKNEYGRVAGLFVTVQGVVPWRGLNACLRATFGRASALN